MGRRMARTRSAGLPAGLFLLAMLNGPDAEFKLRMWHGYHKGFWRFLMLRHSAADDRWG